MKKIKLFLWMIVLIFLGLLVYQNNIYFLTTQALSIDLKIKSWHWTFPELQNIVYWAACFVLGLILSGIMGISSKLRSGKMIKALNKTIDSHAAQISSLRTELEVFINDPYIKKQAENSGTLIEQDSGKTKEPITGNGPDPRPDSTL